MMTVTKSRFRSFAFGMAMLFCSAAFAQQPTNEPLISSMGSAQVKKQADTLRMHLQVQATGNDTKEALAKLGEKKDAIRKQLAAIGADEKSIEFGAPQSGSATNDRQRQMEMMMRHRMAGKGQKKAEEVKTVTVNASLKAEWPMKAGNPEQQFLAALDIQAKVKEAKLSDGGAKPAAELSAEEQEAAEEAEAEMASMMGDESQAKPGEPVFFYVGRINDEERAKAIADAFKNAQGDARRLATAAGGTLGPVRQLSSNTNMDMSEMNYSNNYAMQRYMYSNMAQRQGGDEAISAQPGPVTFHTVVTASFQLKQ